MDHQQPMFVLHYRQMERINSAVPAPVPIGFGRIRNPHQRIARIDAEPTMEIPGWKTVLHPTKRGSLPELSNLTLDLINLHSLPFRRRNRR